jgi:hypothetical protein
MDAATRRLIEALHGAPYKIVLAVTGGGVETAGLLLSVPGGSRTVLEIVVPYQQQALVEFLGHAPAQFCSDAASRDMARRAFERARWLAPGEAVIGLGCTASLVSDRPKRGDHHAHWTIQTSTGQTSYALTFHKGARDREGEEAVLDALLLNALAEATGIAEHVTPPLLPDEVVQTERESADPLTALLRGEVAVVWARVDGQLSLTAPRLAVVVPGSFNPVHDGHLRMAAVAAAKVGGDAAFELSATNVDKPSLTMEEIRRRLAQFAWRTAVCVTRAPTFVEKATLFPGVVFVVGADTAQRLVEARYYQDSEACMIAALEQIRGQGCRFLVAGRRGRDGNYVGLEHLAMPSAHRDLFTAIPQAEFDVPFSSTELRAEVVRAAGVASAGASA